MIHNDTIWCIAPLFRDRVFSCVRGSVHSDFGQTAVAEYMRKYIEQCAAYYSSIVSGVSDSDISLPNKRVPLFRVGSVGIVPIKGVLTSQTGILQLLMGGASTTDIINAVDEANDDDRIKRLILDVDSPGGSAALIAEAADGIYDFRQQSEQRVDAVGDMIASAAYYAASQADRMTASNQSLVGSIGTRIEVYDFSKAYEMSGIKPIPIDSSPPDRPYKSAGMEGTEVTERQIAEWQRIVDSTQMAFDDAVLRGRGEALGQERLQEVNDGRMFIAGDLVRENSAESLGLIDGVASPRAEIRRVVANETARRRIAQ